MGMMLQSLVPGMEHAEEADLGSKVAWIAGDLQQRCRAGVKQQVVDQPFILQGERSQFPRQGEDDVHVTGGKQLPLPRLEPAQAGVAGFCTSCKRWQYVRSPRTDRDVHPALRFGSA